MTEIELGKNLLIELNKNEKEIIERINRLLNNVPIKAKSLHLGIFPSQEGDGMFSIYASAEGPDLYVLSKAIKDYAGIFDPRHTSNGSIVPYVPTLDRDVVDFEVNDIITDCVATWLAAVWEKTNRKNITIPVYITADEGYGTVTPIELTK